MHLKIQASCAPVKQVVAAEMDVLDAAEECCNLYHDMLAAGMECKEISDVMHDVLLVKKTVQESGIRAFHYTLDKENKFAAEYGCTPYEAGQGLEYTARLKTEYIAAAEEGLKTWWAKFVEALKNLWSKFVTWVKTTFTFREKYLNSVKDGQKKLINLKTDASVTTFSCNTADNITEAIKSIHQAFNECKQVTDLKDVQIIAKKLVDTCQKTLLPIGYEFDIEVADNGEKVIEGVNESAPDGYSEKCKSETKTVAALGWSANSAQRFVTELVGIDNHSNFKQTAGKVEDIIKGFIK